MSLRDVGFGRGSTFYGPTDTISSTTTNWGGLELEGVEMEFVDRNPFSNTQPNPRSQRIVRCRLVRNNTAYSAAVLPSALVTFQGGTFSGRVDGMSRTTGQAAAYPADEYLPAAGARLGDLFWIVIEGPALCLTDLGGGANNVLPLETIVVALTAATSGATTAGRVAPIDLTGTTATVVQLTQAIGVIGRVLTARTTSNTNATVLVDIKRGF